MRSRFWIAATLLAASGLAVRANEGPTPLVEGDDPSQFELVAIGPDTIKIVDGEISISGHPDGYFATKKSYRNYRLTFDWRYERPEGLASDAQFRGNSGLLIHIARPHKVWPRCVEVQLMNADAGHIFAIGGANFEGRKDAAAQRAAIKAVGEWNHEEVTCRDGAISCEINGSLVDKGTGAMPDHGPIGWQSEGWKIRFRNLLIRELD